MRLRLEQLEAREGPTNLLGGMGLGALGGLLGPGIGLGGTSAASVWRSEGLGDDRADGDGYTGSATTRSLLVVRDDSDGARSASAPESRPATTYVNVPVVDPAKVSPEAQPPDDSQITDDLFDVLKGGSSFGDESGSEAAGGSAASAAPSTAGGGGGGSGPANPAPAANAATSVSGAIPLSGAAGAGNANLAARAAAAAGGSTGVVVPAATGGPAATAPLGAHGLVAPLALDGSGGNGDFGGLGGSGGSGGGGSSPTQYAGYVGSQWIAQVGAGYANAVNNGTVSSFLASESRVFVFDNQDRVLVNIRAMPGDLNAVEQSAIQAGMTVTLVTPSQDLITGYLPLQDIESTVQVPQELPGFASITPVWAPFHWAGSVTSQGDAVMHGNTFRAATGLDGTGVTVGVLSDSANQVGQGIAGSQATGDLPAAVTVLQDGPAGSTDEGRAMMEVIHDVAPGAALAFTTSDGGPQAMAQGISNLASQAKANVIVDDTLYPNEPFFNSGVISDAIDQVANQKVVYVSAAGNLAGHSWADAFRGVNATVGGQTGTFENFSSSGQNLLQSFSLPVGQTLDLELQWDAAFLEGGTNQSMYQVPNLVGVMITDSSGTHLLQTFMDDNRNTDEALQRVVFTNDGSYGTNNFAISIELLAGPAPTVLKWVRFDNGAPAEYQGSSTIFGHAADPNVVTVGAVNWASPTQPEPFSSEGGLSTTYFDSQGNRLTNPEVNNIKPEVYGPDGVATTFFGPMGANGVPVFSGTSAAAAHIAGAAALLEQKDPHATTGDIALEVETSGSGTVMLGNGSPATNAGFEQLSPSSSIPRAPDALLPIGAPVAVSNEPQNIAEEAIAADPLNPSLLFVDANPVNDLQAGRPGLFVAYSTDGGATWNQRIIGNGTDGLPTSGGDPTCSWDQFGNLFVGYLDAARAAMDILLSTDGGKTFRTLATLALDDQPTVVTGAGMVWMSGNEGGNLIATGARVTGLGVVGAFVPEKTVPNSPNGNFGDIAIGPKGQVMVCFQHANTGNGPDTLMVSLDANGLAGTFATAKVVANLNIGGFSPIKPQPNRTIDAESGLAWDRSNGVHRGRVYLMYNNRANLTTNDLHVYVEYSDNNGATWSTPVQVDDPGTDHAKFLPKIALDESTGFVGVSWYDCRLDNGQGPPQDRDGITNDDANIFCTVSLDGGVSWAQNLQVTATPSNARTINPDGNFDFGDFTGVAFSNGILYPCWADNSLSLPGGHSPLFSAATAAILVSAGGPDRFDPDETTDKAHNFGVLNPGTQTYKDLNTFTFASGLPDYDCFRWTAGASGLVTVSLQVAGELELHVWVLKNNFLIPVGESLGPIRSPVRSVTAAFQKGEVIMVQVKGRNSRPGYHEQGVYNMSITLT